MNDHVERLVHNWFARIQDELAGGESEQSSVLTDLISAIHRMLREAENDTRQRCEDIAIEVAGSEVGGRVALAIRTSAAESLPRKSLAEIRAPDLSQ